MKVSLLLSLTIFCLAGHAQLYIEPAADLHIGKNTGIYVEGDVVGHSPVTGDGYITLNGEALQTVNMNGNSIGNLFINNIMGVELTGNLGIGGSLTSSGGNLSLGNYTLHLSDKAIIGSFDKGGIATNNGGTIRKFISSDHERYYIPLLSSGVVTPLSLASTGSYIQAYIDVSAKAVASPNKPADAEAYLNNYWTINRSGITGTVQALVDISGNTVTGGNLSELSGYYWDDRSWNKADELPNSTAGLIRANITGRGGQIFAMRRSGAGITLMPNPALTTAKLEVTSALDERTQLMIVDTRGRIVRVQTVQLIKGLNQLNVNVSNLANGVYEVKMVTAGKQSSVKMIKQ